MKLLTRQRVLAASHVNRWRGWTSRPYSILEHSVIGCEVMRALGYSIFDQKAFLLHDMHETEIIGDVPTPDKKKFLGYMYDTACDEFDRQISIETGIPAHLFRDEPVVGVDRAMLCAESKDIWLGESPSIAFDHCDEVQVMARALIVSEYARGEKAIDEFWKLWS